MADNGPSDAERENKGRRRKTIIIRIRMTILRRRRRRRGQATQSARAEEEETDELPPMGASAAVQRTSLAMGGGEARARARPGRGPALAGTSGGLPHANGRGPRISGQPNELRGALWIALNCSRGPRFASARETIPNGLKRNNFRARCATKKHDSAIHAQPCLATRNIKRDNEQNNRHDETQHDNTNNPPTC